MNSMSYSKVFLTLDKKNFMCQFGCPGTFNQKEMVHHHLNSHSADELWSFCISLDRLIQNTQTIPSIRIRHRNIGPSWTNL